MSLVADAGPFRSVKPRVLDFLHWLPKGTRLNEASWMARHRLLIAISWVHVPFLAVVGWNTGVERGHGIAEIGLVMVLLLLQSLSERRVAKAVLVSLALVTCSALLVHFTGGLIESHFHFFVVLPLISLYRDWRPMAVALFYVLVHHSLTGVISPELVFNHPAAIANPILWAVIHASYVLMLMAVILAYWRFSENLEGALAREEGLRLHAEEEKLRLETGRLESLVRSKDEFVASVSHELRTPLSAVLGFAQILRDESQSLTAAERMELTITIANEANDIAGIVEDLLVAARSEIGALHVTRVPVDLRANVAQVVEVMSPTSQASIRIGLQAPSLKAVGDPVRVRQIIRNLLSNAIRYGGERITVDIVALGGSVLLAVSDDGPGIPHGEQERIFEAYEIAHDPGSQPSSVGLGLAVARRLARLMSGDLTYERTGNISVFELQLPRAELLSERDTDPAVVGNLLGPLVAGIDVT
jgi:signal transduction histidine kinase